MGNMGGYTAYQKSRAVCRKDLDLIPNGNFISNGYEDLRNLEFIKVAGLPEFWDDSHKIDGDANMADLLAGCVRHGVPFAYAIIGDEKGISVYVGTMKLLSNSLRSSMAALYPGIDLKQEADNPLRFAPKSYGGLFTGIPTDKTEEESKAFQIENICRGMLGSKFSYIILASGISSIAVTLGHERVLEEMQAVYPLITQTASGGAQGNLSVEVQDFSYKNYLDDLEALETGIKLGESRGMWRVNGYYAAESVMDARRLGNIIKSSFSGKDSKPEPFRVIEYNHICDVISNTYMMADLIPYQDLHPLGRWSQTETGQDITLYIYKFQTILNSNQLASMCRLPKKEFPGYYIDSYVEFEVSERKGKPDKDPVVIGDIALAGRNPEGFVRNRYTMEKNDFTRHALIIGITGGGKTNTSKSILNTLWNEKKVPFMVIESAKREYWELRNLKGFEDILVFTLGAEAQATSVSYRLNPFEANPGISLQTHIDYLLATFKAAFDLYPPLPYILEKAVYEVYGDRGWDIVENTNRYGLTQYPTLDDLYHKIDVVIDRLGYHQEVQSNVKAALQARVYSLMIGGKGAMLNTPRSVPIKELLSRPAVMELEDLGDDETKSFVIGLLLVQLYEYRKSLMTKGSKELSHILMVEEAHRLLKNVSQGGEGSDARAKSVEFFCNMLAEVRTFGQGIMIADQIPTKLAPDTIKNTNLKVVHRTVAQEDRETMGRAMNMTEDQIEYLSSLRRGYAAVYAEGDSRPKCVKLPLVESFYDKDRADVIREVKKRICQIAEGYDKVIRHHAGCAFCEHRCRYYKAVMDYLKEHVAVEKVLGKWDNRAYVPENLEAFLNSGLMSDFELTNMFQRICVIGAVLESSEILNEGRRQSVLAAYLEYKYENEKLRRI